MNTKKRYLRDIENAENLIERTLQSFAKDLLPSNLWLSTHLLGNFSTVDKYEAFNELEKLIKNEVLVNLVRARQSASIKLTNRIKVDAQGNKDRYDTTDDLFQALRTEIGSGRKPEYQLLKIWSTLYHKYFVVHYLSSNDFAKASGISVRRIRDYKRLGIESLAQRLIQIEDAMVSDSPSVDHFRKQSLIIEEAESLIILAKSARGLHGEKIALERCNNAISFALRHNLPIHYIQAISIKAFTVLQQTHEGSKAATVVLNQAEKQLNEFSIVELSQKYWGLAEINAMRAHVARRSGNLLIALKKIGESINLLEDFNKQYPELTTKMYTIQAIMNWSSGSYDAAISSLEQLLNEDPNNSYELLELLGLSYWSLSEFDRAESYFKQAIETSKSRNDRWHLACETGNLGLVYLSRGQFSQSEKYIKHHYHLAVELESYKEELRARANLGIVRLHQGDYITATDWLEQAKVDYDNMSAMESQVVVYVNLSQAYQLAGNDRDAMIMARQAYDIACSIKGSYPPRIIAYRCLAECSILDRYERIGYLQSALELCYNNRLYDKAAILLSLASLSEPSEQQINFNQQGLNLMNQINAERWLTRLGNGYPNFLLII